jgi:hypothetical protein
MADIISWVATVATVLAAFMTAANLGPRITGIGFIIFTIGALCWIRVGMLLHEPALLWTNVVLTVLDVFGVWRWLGRQARVEEGARAASQASQETPGEALFPVSLLARAQVWCGGKEIGQCVDAMAGCRSGTLAYVVVSQGGVAGVGETLRRLPWTEAQVDEDRLVTKITKTRFSTLEELQRDEGPAH